MQCVFSHIPGDTFFFLGVCEIFAHLLEAILVAPSISLFPSASASATLLAAG
jgi:hypothetical protein